MFLPSTFKIDSGILPRAVSVGEDSSFGRAVRNPGPAGVGVSAAAKLDSFRRAVREPEGDAGESVSFGRAGGTAEDGVGFSVVTSKSLGRAETDPEDSVGDESANFGRADTNPGAETDTIAGVGFSIVERVEIDTEADVGVSVG